jgi:hypothetical protein
MLFHCPKSSITTNLKRNRTSRTEQCKIIHAKTVYTWKDRPCLCVVACYKTIKALRFSVVKQFQHKTKCNIKMTADKCDEITSVLMSYGQDDQGIRVSFPPGPRDFLFYTASRPALRPTQPPTQQLLGALFPFSAKVKNVLSYTSIPTSSWHGTSLIIRLSL